MLDGRYELEEVIGEGGMAVVWRARHLTLETPVAVKFLKELGEDLKERFVREAKIAAAITHRNVVQVLDFGTQGGAAYMVMEHLKGQSLAERLGTGPIPTPESIRLIAQVLSGLCAVHDRGLAHRDIKPENVFLVEDADGVYPKLFDFGLSKAVGRTPGRQLKSVIPTAENHITGTPEYMSPEQARGLADVDQRTDVWSMGVMLFELLTGHFPFHADNVGDLLVKILTKDAPKLSTYRPDLGPRFDAYIERALHREREERYSNARGMREALLVTANRFATDMVETPKQRGAAKAILHAVSAAYEPGDSGVIMLDVADLDFNDVSELVEWDLDRERRQTSRPSSLSHPRQEIATDDFAEIALPPLAEKTPTIPAPPPVIEIEIPVAPQRNLATMVLREEDAAPEKRPLVWAGAIVLGLLLVTVVIYVSTTRTPDVVSTSEDPVPQEAEEEPADEERDVAPPVEPVATATMDTVAEVVVPERDTTATEPDTPATEPDTPVTEPAPFRLDVRPTRAQVFVDGVRTPTTFQLPDDGEEHLVVVRLAGHRTWSRRLRSDATVREHTVRLVRSARPTMSMDSMSMAMGGFFENSGFR